MGKPVLLFDLDGICCNLMKKWLAVYNRDYHDNLAEDEIVEWEWHKFVKPECGKRIYHYLNRPGFFLDLEPIPGCIGSLGRLSQICELVVVTASPQEAAGDKIRWVRKNLTMVPRGNVVVTYRKDLVMGDFMFDDAPKNLRNHPATRIMMDYPYNRDFHDCHRVTSWAEAEALICTEVGKMQGDRPSAEAAMQPAPEQLQPPEQWPNAGKQLQPAQESVYPRADIGATALRAAPVPPSGPAHPSPPMGGSAY